MSESPEVRQLLEGVRLAVAESKRPQTEEVTLGWLGRAAELMAKVKTLIHPEGKEVV